MDTSKKHEKPSPEPTSGFISKLLFLWIFPIFKLGIQKQLEVKDLYNTTLPDFSEQLGNILEKNWEKELVKSKKESRDPSLWRAIAKTFFKEYAICGAFTFINAVILRLLQPLVLAELIRYFKSEDRYENWQGWLYAASVVIISLIIAFLMHHVFSTCFRIGMRCRVACCSLMYRKLLRLNRASLNQTATGQIVNLMSNDVNRFENLAVFMHYIWIMPILAVVGVGVIYNEVGYAGIMGILIIAIQAILIQGYLSKLQGKYRGKIAYRTDHRVKLMSEITSGIQIIKMYAWEIPFEKVIQLARKIEINFITKKSYIVGVMTAIMVFTERTSLYATVIILALTGTSLSSDLIFSTAQFFNTIQLYMAIFFPLGLVSYAEAKISVKRITHFLLLPESSKNISISESITPNNVGGIRISKGKASWNPNPIIDTLTNLNLDIKPGTLCAVVGSVGSGKSSFLQLLLKELPLSSGKLEMNGVVSYASQEPWLFLSTVRNNILFGQKYVKRRYNEVVSVCAMETDFIQFPYGDKTLVSERGISLSGGQRARVNLARAVYRSADIYLFDDPLSAVDTHVGKHLFEECIVKYLRGKTRILVTHQLQFLKQADQIIIINNGQIEKIGTYAELADKELKHLKLEDEDEDENKIIVGERNRMISITSEASTNEDDEEDEESKETEELMEKGSIPTSTYWQYFNAGASTIILIFLIFLFILAQVACNSGDLWLKHWVTTEEHLCPKDGNITQNESTSDTVILNNITNKFSNFENLDLENLTSSNFTNSMFECIDDDDYDKNFYIYIYTILIILTVILTTIRSVFFFKVCMNASKRLHKIMFENVLQATMRFFDTNPSGRILNRFSKDIGAVDEILPRCMLDSLQIFMVMFGILMMVFIVSPIMIVPAAILALMFWGVRYVYMCSAQDIKRLESTTRAPVFSHVAATVNGLTTIRSCNSQYMVSKEFDELQDINTSSFVVMIYAGEAFGLYLDLISLIFTSIVILQFFVSENVSGGDVGLVISQSLILTGMLQHGMRQTAEVASNMTSVERVLQYTKIKKEGPFKSITAQKPHRDWPQKGEIDFKNVFLQYVPTEQPVLKNLNVKINPGYKVGIVGRTGAGKSSLISAIFRLAPIEGSIQIDDIDTKNIGLYDLRSSISIIPQEPVLFSTSIRKNLDPFEKFNDEILWKALENVELKDAVDKLDQDVSEGGSNFSAGQRQLICLARAIIRNNKIIIMDEATANVDQQTDSLIQRTIRENFKDCTVLTIAHRLNTIMDSDKVLVMQAGEVVEYDHPHILLQNEDGYFYKMVQQTGETMAHHLSLIAKSAYEANEINSNGSTTEDITAEIADDP